MPSTTRARLLYTNPFLLQTARVSTQSCSVLQVNWQFSLSLLLIAENMISFQLTWKPFITTEAPMAISLLPFNAKSHLKCSNFCTQLAASSTTLPNRDVAMEFLRNKCGLTDEDITKTFKQGRSDKGLLYKASESLEEALELFNECGLTNPKQIRRVVLWNPRIFLYKSQRSLKSRINFLRTFMKKDDIAKLIRTDSSVFNYGEKKLKSAISLLQRLGVDGDALSELVGRAPSLLKASEEKVMESFKQAEDLGFKKGSKVYAYAVRVILTVGKENIYRKLRCLSSLGFSEKQILALSKMHPMILALSEKKLKCNVDFLVNSVGLTLDDLVSYPFLCGFSLEKRIIPRYRVMEALKSMRVLEEELSFPKVVKLSERDFLEKYVNPNGEFSSVLQDIYNGGQSGSVVIDQETCSERV